MHRDSVHALTRFDDWALIVELVVLILLVVSVYPVLAVASTSWLAAWGLVLIAGVILLGILFPLALQLRPRGNSLVLASAMVLVVPVVIAYMFLQRNFIESMAGAGIKG